jgi:4-hydroxy-tetrahydrodipicolinate synthase
VRRETQAEFVLLSYPPNFYPESEQDILRLYERPFATRLTSPSCCSRCSLGVLDAHTSFGYPASLDRRCSTTAPTSPRSRQKAVSIDPDVIECNRLFGKEVVISMPIEGELIRWRS